MSSEPSRCVGRTSPAAPQLPPTRQILPSSVERGFCSPSVLPTSSRPAALFASQQVIVHEDYEPYSIANDIAVLKLSSPVRRTRHVLLPPLLRTRQPVLQEGDPLYVAGWGTTEAGSWSPALRCGPACREEESMQVLGSAGRHKRKPPLRTAGTPPCRLCRTQSASSVMQRGISACRRRTFAPARAPTPGERTRAAEIAAAPFSLAWGRMPCWLA